MATNEDIPEAERLVDQQEDSRIERDSIERKLAFHNWHITVLIGSIVFFFYDVTVNVRAVCEFYEAGQHLYTVVASTLLVLPALLLSCLSAWWYLSGEQRRQCFPSPTRAVRLFRVACHACLASPLARLADALRCALRCRSALERKDAEQYRRYDALLVYEDRDAVVLRLVHAFSALAVQPVLAWVGALDRGETEYVWRAAVALGSLGSVAWSTVALKVARDLDANRRTDWPRKLIYGLGHLLGLAARCVALALGAAHLPRSFLVGLALHFFAMFLYARWHHRKALVSNPFAWEKDSIKDNAFYLFLAVAHVFTFLNLNHYRSRGRYLFYFTLCLLENAALMAGWWFLLESRPGLEHYLIFWGEMGAFLLGAFLLWYSHRCRALSRVPRSNGLHSEEAALDSKKEEVCQEVVVVEEAVEKNEAAEQTKEPLSVIDEEPLNEKVVEIWFDRSAKPGQEAARPVEAGPDGEKRAGVRQFEDVEKLLEELDVYGAQVEQPRVAERAQQVARAEEAEKSESLEVEERAFEQPLGKAEESNVVGEAKVRQEQTDSTRPSQTAERDELKRGSVESSSESPESCTISSEGTRLAGSESESKEHEKTEEEIEENFERQTVQDVSQSKIGALDEQIGLTQTETADEMIDMKQAEDSLESSVAPSGSCTVSSEDSRLIESESESKEHETSEEVIEESFEQKTVQGDHQSKSESCTISSEDTRLIERETEPKEHEETEEESNEEAKEIAETTVETFEQLTVQNVAQSEEETATEKTGEINDLKQAEDSLESSVAPTESCTISSEDSRLIESESESKEHETSEEETSQEASLTEDVIEEAFERQTVQNVHQSKEDTQLLPVDRSKSEPVEEEASRQNVRDDSRELEKCIEVSMEQAAEEARLKSEEPADKEASSRVESDDVSPEESAETLEQESSAGTGTSAQVETSEEPPQEPQNDENALENGEESAQPSQSVLENQSRAAEEKPVGTASSDAIREEICAPSESASRLEAEHAKEPRRIESLECQENNLEEVVPGRQESLSDETEQLVEGEPIREDAIGAEEPAVQLIESEEERAVDEEAVKEESDGSPLQSDLSPEAAQQETKRLDETEDDVTVAADTVQTLSISENAPEPQSEVVPLQETVKVAEIEDTAVLNTVSSEEGTESQSDVLPEQVAENEDETTDAVSTENTSEFLPEQESEQVDEANDSKAPVTADIVQEQVIADSHCQSEVLPEQETAQVAESEDVIASTIENVPSELEVLSEQEPVKVADTEEASTADVVSSEDASESQSEILPEQVTAQEDETADDKTTITADDVAHEQITPAEDASHCQSEVLPQQRTGQVAETEDVVLTQDVPVSVKSISEAFSEPGTAQVDEDNGKVTVIDDSVQEQVILAGTAPQLETVHEAESRDVATSATESVPSELEVLSQQEPVELAETGETFTPDAVSSEDASESRSEVLLKQEPEQVAETEVAATVAAVSSDSSSGSQETEVAIHETGELPVVSSEPVAEVASSSEQIDSVLLEAEHLVAETSDPNEKQEDGAPFLQMTTELTQEAEVQTASVAANDDALMPVTNEQPVLAKVPLDNRTDSAPVAQETVETVQADNEVPAAEKEPVLAAEVGNLTGDAQPASWTEEASQEAVEEAADAVETLATTTAELTEETPSVQEQATAVSELMDSPVVACEAKEDNQEPLKTEVESSPVVRDDKEDTAVETEKPVDVESVPPITEDSENAAPEEIAGTGEQSTPEKSSETKLEDQLETESQVKDTSHDNQVTIDTEELAGLVQEEKLETISHFPSSPISAPDETGVTEEPTDEARTNSAPHEDSQIEQAASPESPSISTTDALPESTNETNAEERTSSIDSGASEEDELSPQSIEAEQVDREQQEAPKSPGTSEEMRAKFKSKIPRKKP